MIDQTKLTLYYTWELFTDYTLYARYFCYWREMAHGMWEENFLSFEFFQWNVKRSFRRKLFFSHLETEIERNLWGWWCMLSFMRCAILYFYKYLINFSENYMNELQKENYIRVMGGGIMIVVLHGKICEWCIYYKWEEIYEILSTN